MVLRYLFVLLFIGIGYVASRRVDTADFGRNMTGFKIDEATSSVDIYKRILNETTEGTMVFSPLSIQYLLGLLTIGAKDETVEKLANTLHAGSQTRTKIAEKYQTIYDAYKNSTVLKLGNKVYLQNDYNLKTESNEHLKKYFHSDIENINFGKSRRTAQTINNWLEDNISDKLLDVITQESLNDKTRMLLLNGISFKGEWLKPVQPGPASSMLITSEQMDAFHLDDLNALIYKFNFKDTDLSMIFIYPDEPKEGGKEKIANANILDIQKPSATEPAMYFALQPQVQIDTTINLKKSLTALGIEQIFSDNANFGNFLTSEESLKISDIYLKASIKFGINGVEAVATTWAQLPSPEISVPAQTTFMVYKSNKPLHFAITSKSNIIFSGQFGY